MPLLLLASTLLRLRRRRANFLDNTAIARPDMTEFYTGTPRIRLVRIPPAPVVDGFDMQALRAGPVGAVFRVDARLALYAVAAGYAELYEDPRDHADDAGPRAHKRPR